MKIPHQAGQDDVMDDLRLVAVIPGRRRAHVLRLHITTFRLLPSARLQSSHWDGRARIGNG